ncbi:hypothetical protein LZC95_48775 [Pendulispora brunnea]|uniref:Uncharacterized protein n=1 Tax=Pendulispora brunnea TaxID=2905690 RepID=A0ABZ2KBS2_9BACT
MDTVRSGDAITDTDTNSGEFAAMTQFDWRRSHGPDRARVEDQYSDPLVAGAVQALRDGETLTFGKVMLDEVGLCARKTKVYDPAHSNSE